MVMTVSYVLTIPLLYALMHEWAVNNRRPLQDFYIWVVVSTHGGEQSYTRGRREQLYHSFPVKTY
jgi:hypothetical protein